MKKILILFTLITTPAIAQITMDTALEPERGAGEAFCDGLLLLNQVPNRVNALFSDVDCDACGSVNPVQVAADNFVVSNDAFVSEVVIYVGYFPSDEPLAVDEWTVSFHTNTANQPGFVLYTENNVSSSRAATGEVLFGVDEYRVVLTLETPVELLTGVYWLEVHNNSVESTETVFWVSGAADLNSLSGVVFASSYPATSWSPDKTDHFAMQLCDVLSDTIFKDGFD
jgi:hypothetical protein